MKGDDNDEEVVKLSIEGKVTETPAGMLHTLSRFYGAIRANSSPSMKQRICGDLVASPVAKLSEETLLINVLNFQIKMETKRLSAGRKVREKILFKCLFVLFVVITWNNNHVKEDQKSFHRINGLKFIFNPE